MKVKAMSALAGLGGALIMSSAANAAFVGVALESTDAYFMAHPNAGVQAAWAGGGNAAYDIYRLYANFNSNTAADRVNAFFGEVGTPMTVNVVGGTFYNAVDGHGGHFNLPSGVSPANQAWDTYVTINGLPSGGSASLTPGFDLETNNLGSSGSSFSSENAAVYVDPSQAQGLAVATAAGQAPAPPGIFRVLIAQFTVTAGGLIQGVGGLNVNGQNVQIAFSNVPAPGALALLGLAGLVGSRRRR